MWGYKVGDRFIGLENEIYPIEGKRGTVMGFDVINIIAKMDDNIGSWGNDELNIPKGHGLYLEYDMIKKIEE